MDPSTNLDEESIGRVHRDEKREGTRLIDIPDPAANEPSLQLADNGD